MIVCDVSYPTILNEIASFMDKREVELIFVNAKEMRQINKTWRNINKETDVLSFPLEFLPNVPLGSIVINLDMAQSVAKQLGHSKDEEIALLFVHGMLHLLGFDHEADNGEMREKENFILKKFGFPLGLIIRNDK